MAGKLSAAVVVLTDASSGIGPPTAHAFACQGSRLVLAARRETSLQVEPSAQKHWLSQPMLSIELRSISWRKKLPESSATSIFGSTMPPLCCLAGSTPGVQVCNVLPTAIDRPIYQYKANFAGRKARSIMPVYNPENVVRAVLSRSKRPRREVVVGSFGCMIPAAATLAPGIAEGLIARGLPLLQFGTKGRPATHGNLSRPNAVMMSAPRVFRLAIGGQCIIWSIPPGELHMFGQARGNDDPAIGPDQLADNEQPRLY